MSYDELSEERKKMQAEGGMPDWFSTAGWQLFKSKYLYKADTVKMQYERIAKTAARHLPEEYREKATEKFFNLFWKGHLSPSTPVLSNTGTDRGLPVSCQGADFGDSILSFYETKKDLAVHTQKGFGTSGYLGNVRPRGSKITSGGQAEGVLPLFVSEVSDMQYISQGSVRRGSFAGYLPVMHGDFDELVDYIHAHPEDFNIGWNYYDADVANLTRAEPHEVKRRFAKSMSKLKMPKGKGYFFFPDKANRNTTQAIKNSGIPIQASNLC